MPEELPKIDKLDRRLLYQLDANSRKSVNEMARALRVSEETLRYRLRRVDEAGCLFKYHTIIDTARLGYALHKVYIKLQSASQKVIEEMLRFLDNSPQVVSLVSSDGIFDIFFGVLVERIDELDSYLDAFTRKFHPYIARRSLCINMRSNYLPRDYLLGVKERKRRSIRFYQATSQSTVQEELDRRILAELGISSRKSAAAIARDLSAAPGGRQISKETVLYRIRKLESMEVINGYNVVLNHRPLRQLQYKILLQLNYTGEDELHAFMQSLQSEPELVYIIKTLGQWEYEVELEVQTIEAYRALLMRVTEKHPRLVREYAALFLRDIHIYDVGRRIKMDL